jgi:hypothetical protein
MGLDMWAYSCTSLPAPVDFAEPADAVEIYCWRKHPNTHGWMKQLYEEKGGKDQHFNGNPVELTLSDLAVFEYAVEQHILPETDGFFFGRSTSSNYAHDRAFLRLARAAIQAGKRVFYNSSW